jgi:Ca2+:H+ antiporter
MRPSLNWLLVFVPVAIALEFLRPGDQTLIFVVSCLAIIPLAGVLGHATEHLASRTSESVGGLLNATFGNAAELIIGVMAIRRGAYDIAKASITGSIIGNLLLVLGASVLAGGLRYKKQDFNALAARSRSTSLILAAVALLVPAVFHGVATKSGLTHEQGLTFGIATILVVIYFLSLIFSLRTHREFVSGSPTGSVAAEAPGEHHWSVKKSLGLLFGSTALIAWVAEILVGSVEHAAKALGMSDIFVGVVVVATVGNAAEHSSAIVSAWKNRMDLALEISIGSSIQIALLVAPLLVFASYLTGPQPMHLVFTAPEVMSVSVAVLVVSQIASDGESNWLEGASLLAVYLILALLFYHLS